MVSTSSADCRQHRLKLGAIDAPQAVGQRNFRVVPSPVSCGICTLMLHKAQARAIGLAYSTVQQREELYSLVG
eukprot:9746-Heterococcus_DN1.PRE.2